MVLIQGFDYIKYTSKTHENVPERIENVPERIENVPERMKTHQNA